MAADLEALFEAHRDGLAGAVRGILGPAADVQDVLQEAFLRAWRAREAGREGRDPRAWIFVVTLNTARDARRRWRFRRSAPLEESGAMHVQTRDPGPHGRIEQDEALSAARTAIHGLGENEREVFLLRVSGELTFDAIGTALGIPVGTAKTRMRRALEELRVTLARHAPATERRSS